MARRRVNTTKYEIIKVAAHYFLQNGYSNTSPKMICEELDLSTGNLTYYFPSKDHLLAEITQILCDFQRKMIEYEADEGNSSVMAVCLELAVMAAMTEEDEIAKDLFISIYSSPMCLDIIRQNDAERAKAVYADYCPDWNDEQFAEAEMLVSGIEYATLMTTNNTVHLETRIRGALDNILNIFCIPEEMRKAKIAKVLAMDYQKIARLVLKNFKKFVSETTEQNLEDLFDERMKA